jgi:hypothetical protein
VPFPQFLPFAHLQPLCALPALLPLPALGTNLFTWNPTPMSRRRTTITSTVSRHRQGGTGRIPQLNTR